MDRGEIAQSGTPRELYERPASEFVAGFMGEAMLFDATCAPTAACGSGPLAIRPAAAARRRAGRRGRDPARGLADASPPGDGALAATVPKSAYLGSAREYTFDTELGPIFVASADRGSAIQAGDAASLELGAHGHSVLRRESGGEATIPP